MSFDYFKTLVETKIKKSVLKDAQAKDTDVKYTDLIPDDKVIKDTFAIA
jgi:hypothetical protein